MAFGAEIFIVEELGKEPDRVTLNQLSMIPEVRSLDLSQVISEIEDALTSK